MKKIILIGVTTGIVLAAVLLQKPSSLVGRVLQGEELTRTQIQSDYDRDGDVDFLDFTVFSAFYEEEV